MGWGSITTEKNAGWQDVTVSTASPGPRGRLGWLTWCVRSLLSLAVAVVVLVGSFVAVNWVVSLSLLPALWAWSAGLPWLAVIAVVLVSGGYGAWFWWAAESFDVRVTSPVRQWWRRRRYWRKWADLMVAGGLTVKNRRHRVLAPRLARVRQGRFADVLKVRLPDGITAARFVERLPEITEALRAREARVLPAPRRRIPKRLMDRLPKEFVAGDRRAGVVFLRLAFGDPLAHVVTAASVIPAADIDLGAVRVGRRDDGKDWVVSLLGTHVLLAGATGAGKGSVLWSLIAGIGPAIRDGLVQVVGLDPKGGMELGFGRELFRELVTMDGAGADDDAVAFLEALADEADRRASSLAGYARTLTPSVSMPFLLIVIDELASVTAFIADNKKRQRADAALGRLLTKGRAPGMCVVGALQDPRKEVVKWRDLFPTRIALRLVEDSQVDMVLGDGARKRGARCDEISEAAPGVGYVVEDGSKAVTRVRAGYLTDDDIRTLAQTFRPGPVLHAVEGSAA
jgi:S-DNA-T family DNA segregation ATPase FtsK/SpoIIIE